MWYEVGVWRLGFVWSVFVHRQLFWKLIFRMLWPAANNTVSFYLVKDAKFTIRLFEFCTFEHSNTEVTNEQFLKVILLERKNKVISKWQECFGRPWSYSRSKLRIFVVISLSEISRIAIEDLRWDSWTFRHGRLNVLQ